MSDSTNPAAGDSAAQTARKRAATIEQEAQRALEYARADLDLECPPTAIPIGDAVRRLRRRSRLIDWLITVLIVVTPCALVGMAVALVVATSTTEDVGRRADAVVESNDVLTASNRELAGRLSELESTNAKLEELVQSFKALAVARTPAEREAARRAIETQPTTTRATATTARPAAAATTTSAPAATTTSAPPAPPPATTTTTQPAPPGSPACQVLQILCAQGARR